MANFTGIKEMLNCFERNSIAVNKSIMVINILEKLHADIEDANIIPMPSFIQYCMKKRSINVLVQLLLLENIDLAKVLLNLIINYYSSQSSLAHLLENGLLEALMLHLHTRNGRRVLTIIDAIENFVTDYNEKLDWENKISDEEKKVLEKLDPVSKISLKSRVL
jgi:hypothetical protein